MIKAVKLATSRFVMLTRVADMNTTTTNRNLSRKVFRVADFFIVKNNATNKGLSNKKLQKLLYYSQAWHLVFSDSKPLFDEQIQAWVHGPAIPRVYGQFKQFVMDDIIKDVDENELGNHLSKAERDLLEAIWDVYGGLDAAYLEALTHSEEPWQKARRNLQSFEASTAEIMRSDMKEYYGNRLKEAEKAST